jgi:hypothetical protein
MKGHKGIAGKFFVFKPRDEWPISAQENPQYFNINISHPVIVLSMRSKDHINVVTVTTDPTPPCERQNYLPISTHKKQPGPKLNLCHQIRSYTKLPVPSFVKMDSQQRVLHAMLVQWCRHDGAPYELTKPSREGLQKRLKDTLMAKMRAEQTATENLARLKEGNAQRLQLETSATGSHSKDQDSAPSTPGRCLDGVWDSRAGDSHGDVGTEEPQSQTLDLQSLINALASLEAQVDCVKENLRSLQLEIGARKEVV